MKSIKIKSTIHGLTLQSPMAPLGKNNDAITYQIDEIPDEVSHGSVISLFESTITFLLERKGQYAFKYGDLGTGNILR